MPDNTRVAAQLKDVTETAKLLNWQLSVRVPWTVAAMLPVRSSTFQKPVVTGCHAAEPLRPFTYGWKRLARTSGMQQHTERRSASTGCKLCVTTLAVLERPPPASLVRHRVSSRRSQLVARRQALLQESILETTPSQTNADGRVNRDRLVLSLCLLFINLA